MLEMPMTIDVHTPTGDVVRDQPMWTYWNLQEGEIKVHPKLFSLPDGSMPPVIHLDTDAPLYTDEGKLITDELWGIYFKQDKHGVQGGASPLNVGPEVQLDPYPVSAYIKPNASCTLDSNHGYKMIGVGREVAKVVVGEPSSLLYPFRFERFATGDLHPVSSSPYPWS